MTGVVCTCVVSDKDGQQLENSSITVVANGEGNYSAENVYVWILGTPPRVYGYNFNPYILKYEGSSLTLITKISSDIPISSGYPIWIKDFRLPLPLNCCGGYSRLSL